jgi:hypothetical protein
MKTNTRTASAHTTTTITHIVTIARISAPIATPIGRWWIPSDKRLRFCQCQGWHILVPDFFQVLFLTVVHDVLYERVVSIISAKIIKHIRLRSYGRVEDSILQTPGSQKKKRAQRVWMPSGALLSLMVQIRYVEST